jgi:hypothetical protein
LAGNNLSLAERRRRSRGQSRNFELDRKIIWFATATNTRVLALVGDPELPAYEILLSFDAVENHEEFLRLVEADGYADASEFTVPSRDEIAAARPLGMVFPSEQAELITGGGVITVQGLATDASNSDA